MAMELSVSTTVTREKKLVSSAPVGLVYPFSDLCGVAIHLCNSSKLGKSCRQKKSIDWKSVLL